MSPLIIGIAGGTASGKSWLAEFVAAQLRGSTVTVSQDWYYRDRTMLTPGERRWLNFDHPSAFDYALLQEHLLALRSGRVVRAPSYDYVRHRRSPDGARLKPARIIVLEGLLVLHQPALRALLDFSVFVDVPADVRLIRRLRRDAVGRGIGVEETLRLYEHCVRTMHERFVQPSARHASVVWSPEQDPGFPERLIAQIAGLRPSRKLSRAPADSVSPG